MADDALPDPLNSNVPWRYFRYGMQIVSRCWLGVRARGMEHLPAQSGGLLLINHQSYLDPLMVGLPLRRPVSFLARDSLFKVPLVGWWLRQTYVMSINREAASTASLREAIRRMQHGFLVGIFPEGTRSETGEIGPLKPGFLALMRRAKVPVHPVGIAGTLQALPRGAWFLRPVKIRVVFGEAVSPTELDRFGRDQEPELLSFIRERMLACQQEAEHWRNGETDETSPKTEAVAN